MKSILNDNNESTCSRTATESLSQESTPGKQKEEKGNFFKRPENFCMVCMGQNEYKARKGTKISDDF